MQAIETKFHPPTPRARSRISATCAAGRVFVGYDDDMSSDRNHAAVARELCDQLGWSTPAHGDLIGGTLKNGHMVWVFANDQRA